MDAYKFNLNLYNIPPSESCSLHALEELCEERLRLYKIIDEAHILKHKPNSREWDEYMELQITQRKLNTYSILLKTEECSVGRNRARNNDNIAHWLLSLCYCRTRDLRTFFMNCELQWFVMLYKRMKESDLEEFFIQNNLRYSCISQEEKDLFNERLLMCGNRRETDFYKVKFSEVSNLLAIRKVFLYKGMAYVPKSYLIFCVKNQLWKQFNNQLNWINRMLPTGIKEDRIDDFLKNIHLVTPNFQNYSGKTVAINLENIDEVAQAHFPLCMKTIHSVLRADHHLKYDCKMQYGLFLKSAGLSYQQSIDFWKDEFTKKMTPEWFDRKYSYLFKHQYGKVGGMKQYNSFTCEKIQNLHPGPGQHHGCPFKHWDPDKLIGKCQSDGLNTGHINDLKRLVGDSKYKEACAVYFSATNRVSVGEAFKSPNEYFEASYEFEESLDSCLVDIFDDCC